MCEFSSTNANTTNLLGSEDSPNASSGKGTLTVSHFLMSLAIRSVGPWMGLLRLF